MSWDYERLVNELQADRRALEDIRQVLGPDDICDCWPACRSLRIEAREALTVAVTRLEQLDALGVPL